MKYVNLSKNDPLLWIPKTKWGIWLYLYASYLGLVFQVMLVAMNIWLYIVLSSPANLALAFLFFALALLQLYIGTKGMRAKKARIKTVKDILARQEELEFLNNGKKKTGA